jgi:hypothetical protein
MHLERVIILQIGDAIYTCPWHRHPPPPLEGGGGVIPCDIDKNIADT